MSWLCSRALVAAYLVENSWDGTRFAPLSVTNTPQAYWFKDKTKDTWNPSRFGVTCELLTESRGVELLTWFRAGFPVRTYLSPDELAELREKNQGFGRKWRGLFAKFDQGTFSWRTPQLLLDGGLEQFSGTWPRWGLMRRGACLGLGRLAQTTKGIDFGSLLPTPVADDTGARRKRYAQGGRPLSFVIGGKLNPNWIEWVMGWPIGWTDCAPLETDKFRRWRDTHFSNCKANLRGKSQEMMQVNRESLAAFIEEKAKERNQNSFELAVCQGHLEAWNQIEDLVAVQFELIEELEGMDEEG